MTDFAPYRKRPVAAGIAAAYPRESNVAAVASMIKSFEMVDGLLAALEAGEIDVEQGVPVMRDWEGEWVQIAPALRSWCDCWERIARRMRAELDLGHLRRLANRLDNGMLLEVSDVARARALTDRCRALYLACPVDIRIAAVLDERIAIELDDLGLRKAA